MIVLSVDPGPEIGGVAIIQWSPLHIKSANEVHFAGDVSLDLLSKVLLGQHSFDVFGLSTFNLGPEFTVVDIDHFAIEAITCMGKMVGRSTFDTAERIGDLRRCWAVGSGGLPSRKIPRQDVKIHMCGGSSYRNPSTGGRATVTDTNVKHAIIEKFPRTGGGATPEIGTKPKPGPLFIMKGTKHAWSALAIAITHAETMSGSVE